MKRSEIVLNGIFKENPSLVAFLGMCPSLVASRTLDTAVGMGLAVLVVLVLANVLVSLIRSIVPNEIRIPIYIVIVASLVKSVELLMAAFTPSIYETLGIFIPLIVVNCIILGRAEAFASKNGVIDSLLDAIGQTAGFTGSMILVALTRELLGTGGLALHNPFNATQAIFSFSLWPQYSISILMQPVGAFLIFGLWAAFFNSIRISNERKQAALDKAAAEQAKAATAARPAVKAA